MNTEATFAERLKNWRSARGFSQERVAKMLGVSRSYLNQVEKGARTAGKRLVNDFDRLVNSESEQSSPRVREEAADARRQVPKFDFQTDEGCRAAFEFLLEKTPLPVLMLRLAEILNDESQTPRQRIEMAKAIMPAIERRRLTEPPPIPCDTQGDAASKCGSRSLGNN